MYKENPAWKSWWHAKSPSPEILSFYLSAAIFDICKNEYFTENHISIVQEAKIEEEKRKTFKLKLWYKIYVE